jgi:hypothetical protein
LEFLDFSVFYPNWSQADKHLIFVSVQFHVSKAPVSEQSGDLRILVIVQGFSYQKRRRRRRRKKERKVKHEVV